MRRKKIRIGRKIKKYYRWLRLNRPYFRLVLLTEREIGGELHPC